MKLLDLALFLAAALVGIAFVLALEASKPDTTIEGECRDGQLVLYFNGADVGFTLEGQDGKPLRCCP